LLLLVAVNAPLRRYLPARALRQDEMLLAYLMAVISNTFAGHDMLQNFFGQVTHPHYFAPQNQWQDVFISQLPPGLFVRDEAALNDWYRGNADAVRATGHLVHWIVPLTLWGGFFLTLVFLFGCITVLFRKAWTENERLAFPIIQLPLAITEPQGALFRESRMWIGFAIPFVLGLVNGIHTLYPSVPAIPFIKLTDIGQYFTTQPLEAIRTYGMQISMYPFAIGLAYFIPLDLAFSCWFSYLLARGFFVAGRASGLDGPSAAQGWPFLKEISSGAWIGLAGAILWSNRKYLARAFDLAFDPATRRALEPKSADGTEAGRYRFAYLGLLLSASLLMAWSYFLLSIGPIIALGFFGILIALSLGITRIRAEFGTPHEIVFVKPTDTLVTLLGTKAIGDSSLIGLQSMFWFNRGYRCHPMPNLLEAFKMSQLDHERTAGQGPMTFARTAGLLALACVVSLLATYVTNYYVTYDAGAQSKAIGYKQWVGQEGFAQLAAWLKTGQRAGSTNLYFFGAGLGLVGLFAYLRTAFLWWPLHPAGFALGISYAMNYFWFCVLIAWAAKLLITRYGGMNAHKQAIPFFLGLILGDYTIGALWSLVGLIIGTPAYKIFI
ncbi:MAG: hypothetical protein H7Z41_16025, partial [Cytophagales bacterium]|nr:hypothetical protein [Armatimonadota bacterium]